MRVIIDHFQDFWQLNPNLLVVFGKDHLDSDTMWAITYYVHPESDLAFYDRPQRKELISKNIFSIDWDDPVIQDTIKLFENGVLTRSQKHVVLWRNKLEERDDFMRNTPYNPTTQEMLDKMMKESRYLWPQLEEAEEKLMKDTMSSQVEGGGEESLADKEQL